MRGRVIVGKTLIDVDDQLLQQARTILGAETKKDTINRALREIVRRDAAYRFMSAARAGAFEPSAGDMP
jgi:Arc/MetJ family transcription regulator